MYKLYLDKSENFECEVSVKNASLKNSIARLMVECDGLSLAFKGEIQGDKCVIPIKRLKGLLEENARGKMHLEVVVEDTYFKPWESDFIVEEHTSVKVKVNEQTKSNKPIVEVKTRPTTNNTVKPPVLKNKKSGINVVIPLNEISSICNQFGIDKQNLHERRVDFKHIIKEYLKENKEYNIHLKEILSKIGTFLS